MELTAADAWRIRQYLNQGFVLGKTRPVFGVAAIVLAATIGHAQSHPAEPSPAQLAAGARGERATFQPRADAPKYASDRIIVRFRPGTPKFRSEAAHAAVKARTIRAFKAVRDLEIVRLPEGMQVEAALRAYRKDPAVLYAEPDYVVHALQNPATPNDPRFAELWGIQKIQAPQAWGTTAGSPQVVVAVIDTGIDYNHEDLTANMFRNPVDCNSNGVDDDGNGYADDCHGFDAANGDSDPMDDNGHGTHVAGTIGAAGNNGVGVVGVNWKVQLMACKFLDDSGSGFTSDAVTCLDYVATMKERGVNVVATNNSWGGGDFSQALLEAIDLHRQRGILFVAAAGNDGSDNDTSPSYPDGYFLPNVISAGATERTADDRSASFSNFGRRSVHLGAPGVDILSTTPGNTYDSFSGTSMAAPHVTGVAALLAAQDSTRDWKAIKNLLLAGGDTRAVDFDPVGFRIFLNSTVTRKRLNAYGALTCSDSPVLARLQPRTNQVTFAQGLEAAVDIAVLHINCAAPNGEVTVLVDGGPQTVTLLDDGQGADQEAGDGIYSGQWIPPGVGSHTLTIPNGELQLVDPDDNTTTVVDDVFTVQVLSPYTFSTNTAFNYRQFAGNRLGINGYGSQQITPGFPILFGGGRFDSLFVNSNGTITFLQASGGVISQPIPAPPNFIATRVAALWESLYVGGGGVFWEAVGNAPNQELIIEWRDVPQASCQSSSVDTVKFQVVFFEGSSEILFNYADVVFGGFCAFADQGATATVGVQVAPQVGTQFSFNTPSLADNMAILWTLGAPSPVITRLDPFTALAGGPGFTLKVSGSNFVPTSAVYWNGSALAAMFSNSSELAANISAADIAAAGSVQVSVVSPSPGGNSNLFPFTIYNSYPVPSLTSLDPSQVIASGCTICTDFFFPLTVTGTDFVSSSVVRWNGADRLTTVLSSTQAQAQIPYSDVANGGTVEITVFNPAPGGGASDPLTLAIENPAPLIDSVYPEAIAPGTDRTVTVRSGFRDCADPANDPCYSTFVPSSVVRWNGADRPTIYLSADQLEAAIPASDVAAPGTAEITVFTPAPGGGASNAVLIEIVPSPANDHLADALEIFAFPFNHMTDTRTATTEPADLPFMGHALQGGCHHLQDVFSGPVLVSGTNTVWYRFVPSTTATVRANMIGTDYAAMMATLTGSPGAFSLLRCTRTFDNPPFNEHEFTATGGQTYYFLIGAYPGGDGGHLVFNLSVTGGGPGSNSLTINFAGSGSGVVTSNPAGVNCTGTCGVNFTSGTAVTLTANAASGSVFSGWSGACTGSGSCSLTMDAARAVTATFNLQQEFGFGNPPTPQTVAAGQPAQFTIQVLGQAGFTGVVSFACTAGVPQGAACSFNPASVSPGSGTATTMLTVTTTSRTLAMSPQASIVLYACWLLPLSLLVARRARCARQWALLANFAILLLLAGTFVACGGGDSPAATARPPNQSNPSGTPAGTYTITVTATSGSTSRTQAVTLAVN